MNRYIPILAATVACAAGCSQQAPSAATETTSAAQTGSGTTATLSKEDREFMSEAAIGGMYEVVLGEQIAKKATDPDVRAFAAKMVADHSKANEELKQLAAKKGFTMPAQLDEDHRESIEELTKLSGPELDRKYIDEMVDDHEDDVDEFRDAAKDAKDPEIRAWAGKTLRVLEGHLAEAKRLKERLGA